MTLKENVSAFAVKQILSYMDKDPEKNFPKLLDWFDRFDRKDTLKAQREAIRKAVVDKDNNWRQLVISLWTIRACGTVCLKTSFSMAACSDIRDRMNTKRNITAISPGQFFSIPPAPAI